VVIDNYNKWSPFFFFVITEIAFRDAIGIEFLGRYSTSLIFLLIFLFELCTLISLASCVGCSHALDDDEEL